MAYVYVLVGVMVLVVPTSVLFDMLGLQGHRSIALFFGCLLAIWLCTCFAIVVMRSSTT
jgi:hypothetical protein